MALDDRQQALLRVFRFSAVVRGEAEPVVRVMAKLLEDAARNNTLPESSRFETWLRHHTLLRNRAGMDAVHDLRVHPLIRIYDAPSADYRAFVKAFAELPYQQREAVILTHAHKLPERDVAIAMDCSTQATRLHLDRAMQQLRLLGGAETDRQLERLRKAYEHVEPTEPELSTIVSAQGRGTKARSRRRTLLVATVIVVVAVVIAVAWGNGMLEF